MRKFWSTAPPFGKVACAVKGFATAFRMGTYNILKDL